MNLNSIDFETYYSDTYNLDKLTTEAYVRSEEFQPLILSWKVNDSPAQSVGGKIKIQQVLDSLDIENNACVAHHSAFDGLILSHHFGHRPKRWYDTLSEARAINAGTGRRNSLDALLEYNNAPMRKGTYVNFAKNKRLEHFSRPEFEEYKAYGRIDVEGCFWLWQLFTPQLPPKELQQIDWVIRMFTEPTLYIDDELIREKLEEIRVTKVRALINAGVQLDQVMSTQLFAEALQRLGVEVPTKPSLTRKDDQGRPIMIPAFAKTDEGLLELQEHDDPRVQALVAARLGAKQTLEETRIVRLLDMSSRGAAPIFYNYAGAEQTYRLSGGDSMNWQNNKRGGVVRDAIYCDEDHVLMPADSAQIEPRTLNYVARQEDILDIFRAWDNGVGPDVYCVAATRFYQREITPANHQERQLGKLIEISCGYQTGGDRLQVTARQDPYNLRIDLATAHQAKDLYRSTHPRVVALWKRAQTALEVLAQGRAEGDEVYLDPRCLFRVTKGAIWLPNGFKLRYPDTQYDPKTDEWSYQGKRSRKHIYGGKIVENLIQALARIIVMDQTMEIRKRYPVVMHSHDEPVLLVRVGEEQEAAAYAKQCLRTPPTWAPDIPLNAKVAWDRRYGMAKN